MLPGDLFDFHRWGGTVDSLAPALSRRPVAERSFTPYADLRATDLHWTVDALVHQRRLLPRQLPPLLALLGVERSSPPATTIPLAAAPPSRPTWPGSSPNSPASPGRVAARARAPGNGGTGWLGPPVALPQVRRYDLPTARRSCAWSREPAR